MLTSYLDRFATTLGGSATTMAIAIFFVAAVGFVCWHFREGRSLRELRNPTLKVGVASAYIPTGLLLMVVALRPKHVQYLASQRLQLALLSVVMFFYIGHKIRKQHRELVASKDS